MDIDEIQTFVTVARLGSFSRAALALHRSQPAISRRIEMLESGFDVPLFERGRGGVALTDAGAALLPHAEAMLAAARDGAEAVSAVRQGEGGAVTLALVGSLANAGLTDLLGRFRERHPQVRLDLQTAISQTVGDLVLRGAAQLGLRYLADPRPGLVSQTIAMEQMRVVCPADHPLADGRRHRASELAGEKWVAFASSRSPRESFVQFLEGKLRAAGLGDLDVLPIDGLTAQKRLVEAGFGIALLAESGIEEELRTGTLKVVDVPALQASIPVTVVHRRDGYLGAAARSLLAMITTPQAAARGRAAGAGRAARGKERKRA